MELIKLDRLKELEKRDVAVEGLQPLLKGAEGEKWVFDTLIEFGQPQSQKILKMSKFPQQFPPF